MGSMHVPYETVLLVGCATDQQISSSCNFVVMYLVLAGCDMGNCCLPVAVLFIGCRNTNYGAQLAS